MRSISCWKQSIGNRKESNAKYSSNKFIIMNFHFAVFHSFFSSHLICVLACRSLGLTKIKTPPGHHRKRLAVESSRHHSRPDDSHMFIIKLPPNPYYYANSNTAQNKNGIEDKNQKVRKTIGWPHFYTVCAHWNDVEWMFSSAFTEISFSKPYKECMRLLNDFELKEFP